MTARYGVSPAEDLCVASVRILLNPSLRTPRTSFQAQSWKPTILTDQSVNTGIGIYLLDENPLTDPIRNAILPDEDSSTDDRTGAVTKRLTWRTALPALSCLVTSIPGVVRAERRDNVDAALREAYDAETVADIVSYIRGIYFFNLAGNTLDFLRARWTDDGGSKARSVTG